MRNTGKGMQGRGAVTELLQGLPVPALAPPAGDQTLLLSFVAIRFVRGSRVRRRLHIAVSRAARCFQGGARGEEGDVLQRDGGEPSRRRSRSAPVYLTTPPTVRKSTQNRSTN